MTKVIIKDSKKGFVVGFDADTPLFGDRSIALPFETEEAIGLCFELDDPQNPSVTTIQTRPGRTSSET